MDVWLSLACLKAGSKAWTLFIVLRCVLNKNAACLWVATGRNIGDNGRYAPANNSTAVLLANFSSPHLHNQRNV